MKRWSPLLVVVLLLFAPGCIYTHVTTPLDIDLQDTDLGDKTGRSEYQSVMWLVAWGDAGTQAAAKDGKITTLKHAGYGDPERPVGPLLSADNDCLREVAKCAASWESVFSVWHLL